jgi:hypothetical protein
MGESTASEGSPTWEDSTRSDDENEGEKEIPGDANTDVSEETVDEEIDTAKDAASSHDFSNREPEYSLSDFDEPEEEMQPALTQTKPASQTRKRKREEISEKAVTTKRRGVK